MIKPKMWLKCAGNLFESQIRGWGYIMPRTKVDRCVFDAILNNHTEQLFSSVGVSSVVLGQIVGVELNVLHLCDKVYTGR